MADQKNVIMVRSWTLPLKGHEATLVELPETNRRKIQKDVGVQTLRNENCKLRNELAILKQYQKELMGNFLNAEMQRDQLKAELEATHETKQHLSSLLCAFHTMITCVEEYASKLAKKRIQQTFTQSCPDNVLKGLRQLLDSHPHILDSKH